MECSPFLDFKGRGDFELDRDEELSESDLSESELDELSLSELSLSFELDELLLELLSSSSSSELSDDDDDDDDDFLRLFLVGCGGDTVDRRSIFGEFSFD